MPKESKEKAIHLRSMHWRQLTDERYYQGEHEPRGSRFVEVKPSVVGRASPSTQEVN